MVCNMLLLQILRFSIIVFHLLIEVALLLLMHVDAVAMSNTVVHHRLAHHYYCLLILE